MSIRRAQAQDIPDILRLLVQVNMVHHNARPDLFKGPATKYSAAELREILRDDDNPVFVYTEGDQFLGYIFCQAEICKESPLRTGIRTLYIDDLCVDETARGQHVGESLYRYVLDYAKKLGFYNVTLHVWGGNDGAQAFYEKMGLKTQYICMEQIL
jgi:ribosomal protein S18 acetylase RimI-like enzyme